MSEKPKKAEANPAGQAIKAQAEIIEEAIGVPRMLSSCGHALSEAKYAGTASWQNRWRCNVCGKFFSR